jgi:hypothetical protein
MPADRRRILALLTASIATPAFGQSMSRVTAYAFSFAGARLSPFFTSFY